MLRVVGCILQDHDLGLVFLAFLVCVLGATTTARLLSPGPAGSAGQDRVRLGAGIVAFGSGVWTAHFIALLAYHPGMGIGYDVPLCLLSLALSFGGSAVAFNLCRLPENHGTAYIGGGLALATGICLTHFVGTGSLRLPGSIHYDFQLIAVAVTLGGAGSVASTGLLARHHPILASVFLTLSVLVIHFFSMASMTLELVGGADLAPRGISTTGLAIAVGGACLVLLALATAASIIDNQMANRRLNEARRLRILADASLEGLILERQGRIVDVNRAMSDLAGRDTETLIGLWLADIIPGIVLTSSPPDRPIERAVLRPDGQRRPVEMLWRDNLDGDGHVVAIRDLSREKAAESQIERLVRFDSLTGLPNRVHFDGLLRMALALSDQSGDCVALLHIDLARFDAAAQALGRWASEQILVQAARRLSGIARSVDTLVRLGWTEFAIIRPNLEQSGDPADLAEQIVAAMTQAFLVDGHAVELGVNVGFAVYPADCTEADDLIRGAALASHQAKLQGLAHWGHFEPAMEVMLRAKHALERDLRLALGENQFSLNYQPFVEIATRRIVGYEALLRWNHPQQGNIPPGDFITLAEELGLIVPIGCWVLATACAEAMSWPDQAIVSVNLSPAQFVQPGIVSTVATVLASTGLPAARLELEITEGVLMDDIQNAMQVLRGLKALGVKIAMDDFGTGYSSLGYLRKFPFDKIKIDRSFISDVDKDAEAASIVRAIIALGASLKLAVTAEGVETEGQLRLLRAHGCLYAQGFLLGRPMPASQIQQQPVNRPVPISEPTPFVWHD